jgi:CheY-specific phosphatase CheX
MSGDIKDLLAHVTAETLEGLAFVFAFDEGEIRVPDGACVRIDFSGPFDGAFFLSADELLLDEITRNMLGLDDDSRISQSQREDALKETANVICGNLLPKLGGKDAVFDFIPSGVFSEGLDHALNGKTPSCEVTLSLDESVCRVSLCVEDEQHLDGLG